MSNPSKKAQMQNNSSNAMLPIGMSAKPTASPNRRDNFNTIQ